MKYKEKKTCRTCGSADLKLILDLNNQPLANSYHKRGEKLDEYPLKLNLCKNCFHSQLSIVVDPDEMFKNYLYVSGTTKTLKQYFEEFSGLVSSYIQVSGSKKVLDIACNDGTQLESFRERGWETFGIDPAENIYKLSSTKGFTKVICDYFNESSASSLGHKMDVIIAQNVFAHTDDIQDFLRCCKLISHEKTKIFIQTSQADMFANGEFDTIYHEHLSFFCANSMKVCADLNGLNLEEIIKTNIHGKSYVFILGLGKIESPSVANFLKKEAAEGKTSVKFYEEFAEKSKAVVQGLKSIIKKYQELGYQIVGYGAAAKAMTLLNFGNISLDFIVDDNSLKHGLLTPGTDTMIYGPEILRQSSKMLIIPLAWNFYEEIKARVKRERQHPADLFVKYFPSIEIEGG